MGERTSVMLVLLWSRTCDYISADLRPLCLLLSHLTVGVLDIVHVAF